LQGVDSAVHMAEEVKNASRTVPRMGKINVSIFR
jgi:amino acid transporter